MGGLQRVWECAILGTTFHFGCSCLCHASHNSALSHFLAVRSATNLSLSISSSCHISISKSLVSFSRACLLLSCSNCSCNLPLTIPLALCLDFMLRAGADLLILGLASIVTEPTPCKDLAVGATSTLLTHCEEGPCCSTFSSSNNNALGSFSCPL